MATERCEREVRLLAALRDGRAGEDDFVHLAACASCALAAEADRWLRQAAAAMTPESLPSPGALLLRARLRAQREAAERSLRPIAVWRRLALAVGGAALAGVALGSPFFSASWSAAPSPALALFAAGTVLLAALPVWFRLRRADA